MNRDDRQIAWSSLLAGLMAGAFIGFLWLVSQLDISIVP